MIQDSEPEIDLTDSEIQQQFVNRLCSRYRFETANHSGQHILSIVQKAFAGCVALEIYGKKEIYRFLALSILLTSDQLSSPLIEGVLKRIIGNTDWSDKKRLDFLYTHLIGRSDRSDDTDFGDGFVPQHPKLSEIIFS